MSRRILPALAVVLGLLVWAVPAADAATGGGGAAPLWGVTPDASWAAAAPDGADAAIECGGAGQFACLNADLSYATPYKGCNSDRFNNILNICSPCGGSGQVTCSLGLTCSVGNRNIFNVCTYSGYSDEPTTNVAVMPTLTQPATGPVRGIVDLHAHMFSNLGFGGVIFWGAPYDEGGINEALPWCDYSWKFPTASSITGADQLATPYYGYEIHGPKGTQALTHPISNGVEEGYHDVAGTGPFDGWPTYQTYTHQQMYYKWVERAYLGGLRMMVQLAVSNEALCGSGKRRADFTCDDMEAVDRQIQGTKDLEAAIDRMDDGLANGSGWFRIAYSPAQARTLIRNGKMAVVLGIEVDSLFGCKPGVACSAAYINDQLQKYYNLGVRHVFPIHQYDNGFGGAAIFRDELNAANRIVAGHHFQVRDCSAEGYTYNVNGSGFVDFLAWLLHGAAAPDQSYYDQFAADCNAEGLSATGRVLVNALMDKGFIIDVDHMSRLMLDDVLAIALARNYPLVSGHSSFGGGNGGSEFSLTDAQMASIKQLGGMVSAIDPRGSCGTTAQFAYHYRYGVGGMQQAPGDRFAAVGFSTDMNGFGGATGPRFGDPDCPGTPGTELSYPFKGIMGGSFNLQRTGGRDFDFNYQGLAHYGLLADFFADLKNTGLTTDDLEPLLNSAESYIRMWTRADPGSAKPTVRAIVTGTQSPGGFAYVSDVHLRWEITGGEGYDVALSSGCAERTITQDTPHGGETWVCRAETYYELSDHSRAVVASDEKSVTIRRDTTPPTIAWGAPSPSANPAGWHKTDVTIPFTATDVTTGVDSQPALVLTTEGEAVTGTVTLTDWAGNTATYTSPVVRIDKTAPGIQFLSHVPAANPAGWNRENPTLTWMCSDALSGPVDVEVSRTLTLEGPNGTLIGRCMDLAGNIADDRRSGLKLDRTAPTLEWAPASPVANPAGWNNTDVSRAFTTADTISGVASASQASPLVLTAEGAAVAGTVSVTDVAGNTATFTSPAVRIDKTAPSIAFLSHLPAANAAGWNRESPTVTWQCDDGLSGVVAGQVSQTLTTEGAGQALTGQCVDLAGNQASATRGGLNLDTTAPTLAWAPASPTANAAGWHNTDVAFAFTPADALSGVEGTSQPSPLVLVAEGAAVTRAVTVTDVAGNTATFTSPAVRIDKTPPVVTCVADTPVLWPANNKLVPVSVALSLSDGLSGGVTYVMSEASSNEPGAGGDIAGFTVPGVAVTGALRATRRGNGAGRIYTLGYTGTDLAGNSASCATVVAVPHDQGGKSGKKK
ncbi:MAG: membrane dipeptidase [Vicinamibacterales bacterium]